MRRVASALICLAIAGCGGSKSASGHGAEREVRTLVSSYDNAVADGDFGGACEDLTPARRASLLREAQRAAPSATTCAQAVRLAATDELRAAVKSTHVKSIVIKGARARIELVRVGKPVELEAVRAAGGWKVNEPES